MQFYRFLFVAGVSLFPLMIHGQNNPIGITYHNVTAHYNGYFIAKERIKEIELTIEDQYQWNYNRVLPIFPQYDTATSTALESQLRDCIEKASIAIQRHPESRWEDNAYILVGKARMYGSEFPDAIETFKWVNTNGDDKNDQHHALTQLLRTFTEANEMRNALAVYDFLNKKELNEENLRRFHLNSAYYFQKRDQLSEMVGHLVQAEETMPNGSEKARIDFIIGQVYQELGFEANAYDFYKNALKRSNTYELSFYTKLNMAQVTQMKKSGNVKKVQKYFKRLLKDPKNLEYQDRIYYEMAEFELKRGELKNAIANYQESLKVGTDSRQKSYAYLGLASIYYDSLSNYNLAKIYYDSTVQVLPTDEENYTEIKRRQEVLSEFVKYYDQLINNDSLYQLSQLGEVELKAIIEAELDRMELAFTEEQEEAKKARRRASILAVSSSNTQSNQVTINQDFSGTWYFYNTQAVSVGLSEFRRKWGNRTLQDNWRVSSLTIVDLEEKVQQTSLADAPKEEKDEEAKFDKEAARNKLIAGVPSDSASINQLLAGIEESYYELGKIYNFKLEEKSNALKNFDLLISRFPESKYMPEVLYQVYLIHKPFDSIASNIAANQLIEDFPETVYAKLITNPNYREEQKAINEAYRIIYEEAYDLFDRHEYKASLRLIDSALNESPENDIEDNLALLRAMNFGETEGIYKYQFELNNFIKNYPTSEVVEHAKLLVKASEDYQINLYSSSKAKFVQFFDTTHYHIVVYHQKPGLGEDLGQKIEEFLSENFPGLTTGNLVLDSDYSLILVNSLSNKSSAETYLKTFSNYIPLNELYKGEKIYSVIITTDNFGILYETKDLDSYISFFHKHY